MVKQYEIVCLYLGIGYQTAKSIAKLGGRVIIACRNEEKANQVGCHV